MVLGGWGVLHRIDCYSKTWRTSRFACTSTAVAFFGASFQSSVFGGVLLHHARDIHVRLGPPQTSRSNSTPATSEGGHKAPDFVAKPPFGRVPFIDDDGLILYDSRAIGRKKCCGC
ncbi:hypothetical protein FIBSPDRAFT_483166 [Athelia psychrophila]|uniref:GST N-terminal domain-containing protein n=1 Tax=Athelia psychrophila TaxID=1759441 RepID=A0A166L1A9_9AGAM|nr:hypothetical protein FIBSPDRAFT_483166 [Fibularhizoctonia sp. CBS 109695]